MFRATSLTDPQSDLKQSVPHGTILRAVGNNHHKVTIINREAWIQFRHQADWDIDGDTEQVFVWTILTNEFGEHPYIQSNEWMFLSRAFDGCMAHMKANFSTG